VKYIIFVLLLVSIAYGADTWEVAEVVVPPPTELDELTDCGDMCLQVAWDANTEPDLKGYKVYRGRVSRLSSKLDKINQWCAAHEPTNEKCVEEWEEVCPEPLDKQCHAMIYEYDDVFDVAKLPDQRTTSCPDPYDPFKTECCEFNLINHEEGTYYYSATAYDDDGNESTYSEELVHTFVVHKPKITSPKNVREVKEE